MHTDCQSAIKALERLSANGHPLVQLAPPNQATRLRKIDAHPELIKAAAQYTVTDKGIFLADAVASGQLEETGMIFIDAECMTVSDCTIIHDLSRDIPHPYVSTLQGYLNLEPESATKTG